MHHQLCIVYRCCIPPIHICLHLSQLFKLVQAILTDQMLKFSILNRYRQRWVIGFISIHDLFFVLNELMFVVVLNLRTIKSKVRPILILRMSTIDFSQLIQNSLFFSPLKLFLTSLLLYLFPVFYFDLFKEVVFIRLFF